MLRSEYRDSPALRWSALSEARCQRRAATTSIIRRRRRRLAATRLPGSRGGRLEFWLKGVKSGHRKVCPGNCGIDFLPIRFTRLERTEFGLGWENVKTTGLGGPT